MGGHIDFTGIPEPIAKVYWQASESLDKVQDPRLRRAIVGVLREVQKEATAQAENKIA